MNKETLTRNIALALILGVLFGIVIHYTIGFMPHTLGNGIKILLGQGFDTLGKIFLKLLSLIVIPVVLTAVITGITGLSSQQTLSRLGTRTILLYLTTTAIAITLALLVANTFDVGEGVHMPLEKATYHMNQHPSFKATLLNMIPSNFFAALAQNNLLQIMVFSVLFGIAILNAGEAGKRLAKGFDALNAVIIEWVYIILKLAPIGVFSLVLIQFAQFGLSLVKPLMGYFMTILCVLFLHVIIVHRSLIRYFTDHCFLDVLKKLKPAILFAFGTASSSASIPVTLQAVREELKVSASTSGFVIPLGATINMDGTSIMQGVATVFIAHLYQIPLALGDYMSIIAMATLASIGTAGVPSAGMITLAMVLQQVGIPIEGIALIIGIDRLLDMVRTAVNVLGDATVACVVDHAISGKSKGSSKRTAEASNQAIEA